MGKFKIGKKPKEKKTLRDEFAMATLQGIIRVRDMKFYPAHDAKWAYEIADAMLAERAKK